MDWERRGRGLRGGRGESKGESVGLPLHSPIEYKAPWEVERIGRASRIVAEALLALRDVSQPGVKTLELDRFAEVFLRERGARPAFKGYRGYPFTLCTSVNEQVVHGLPAERPLQGGEIVSLGLGAIVDGEYGEAGFA